MAIDGNSVGLPVTLPVHGSQAPLPAIIHPQSANGGIVPQAGNGGVRATQGGVRATVAAASNAADPGRSAAAAVVPLAAAGAPAPVADSKSSKADPATLVAALNKYLNDSGRPDQFRLASAFGATVIEQINPASGAVIGEYSAAEFPALARGIASGGTLVDSTA